MMTFLLDNQPGALVHLYKGMPVTDSLAIAREFERRHKHVLQFLAGLIQFGTISRHEFKPRDCASANGGMRRITLAARLDYASLDGISLALPIAAAKKLNAMALAILRSCRYRGAVPEKEGAGFDSLNAIKRTHRAMRFFYVCSSPIVLNGRRWWGSLRACWFSFLHQSVNPTICRPPHLTVGRGSTAKKDRIMTTASTTTPIQSRSEKVNHLAGQADAIGALLAVIQFMPADARPSVLLTCASLADEFAADLNALAGGAA
jgi:hypothetical protein